MRRRRGLIALAAVLLTAACSAPSGSMWRAVSRWPTPASTPGGSGSMPGPTRPGRRPSTPPPKSIPKPQPKARQLPFAAPTPGLPALPRGGQRILPSFRVVAYYGAPGTPALGVLGRGTPDQAAVAVERQARAYARFARPVQPAMELIATVAQAGPGPDGLYSRPVPASDIARYLAAAHRHRQLLILDFQPGRGEFLPQVRAVAPFLNDPSVGVALDPEWKVGPTQVPGQVIGSASAASINAVGRYLSRLVTRRHLPDKLLVVHQFRLSMLPDRSRIARPPGLEVVLHADGLAAPAEKIAVYRKLAFPAPPFHAGFKLFYREDTGLMTPAQVMALRPQPEVVTYQ